MRLRDRFLKLLDKSPVKVGFGPSSIHFELGAEKVRINFVLRGPTIEEEDADRKRSISHAFRIARHLSEDSECSHKDLTFDLAQCSPETLALLEHRLGSPNVRLWVDIPPGEQVH